MLVLPSHHIRFCFIKFFEDSHDWAVLTTRIDGIYHLPQKLLEAGGPLPELGTASRRGRNWVSISIHVPHASELCDMSTFPVHVIILYPFGWYRAVIRPKSWGGRRFGKPSLALRGAFVGLRLQWGAAHLAPRGPPGSTGGRRCSARGWGPISWAADAWVAAGWEGEKWGDWMLKIFIIYFYVFMCYFYIYHIWWYFLLIFDFVHSFFCKLHLFSKCLHDFSTLMFLYMSECLNVC